MAKRLLLTLLLGILITFPAAAQEPPAPGGGDSDLRTQLARRIHEFRPIALQVRDALGLIAADLPSQERALFQASVMANINIAGLEQTSIETMAQTFTTDELQLMIDYYSRPESGTIEQKSPLYRQRIDPQIVTAITDALNRIAADLTAQAPQAALPRIVTPGTQQQP